MSGAGTNTAGHGVGAPCSGGAWGWGPGRGGEAARNAALAEQVVASVVDPELPFLSIADLGILRDVSLADDGRVEVTVTPTYSGCPATEVIAGDIVAALEIAGYTDTIVRTELAPAWTTDWITPAGRRKLAAAGIAPPGTTTASIELIRCPHCGSGETRLVSRFGSTACKALRACRRCLEPFDHFRRL